MPKVWDNETGDFTDDFNKIDIKSDAIKRGLKRKGSEGLNTNIEALVGMCATCTSYAYAENSVHELIFSICTRFECTIGKQRVTYCNKYKKRGYMSLQEMYAIATIIDPALIKNKPGF